MPAHPMQCSPELYARVVNALKERGSVIGAWASLKGEIGKSRIGQIAAQMAANIPGPSGTGSRPFDVQDPLARSALIRIMRGANKGVTLERLATKLNSTDLVGLKAGIENLIHCGYTIEDDCGVYSLSAGTPDYNTLVDHSPLVGDVRTFGLISDTHLCSKCQRLDVLEAAYDTFAAAGVKAVYHAGNIVDGHTSFNRYDLLYHGITDQANYCLDHYPQRKGMTTYYIAGSCHEGWWLDREGLDFGRYLSMEAANRGRKDMVYLGFGEADVEFRTKTGGSAIMKIMHPGGGSAYATSYAPQKIVESFSSGEKPAILLIGHYHKMSYNYIRGVHTVQAGTCQDQTWFMRKNKLDAHVGFCLVSMRQDVQGAVREFTPAFTTFYDRKYHVKLVETAGK